MKLKQYKKKLPKFLYHVSNPKYRAKIAKEGLVPQIGESYRLHWESEYPNEEIHPCVFLSLKNDYDSTYDDDRYVVSTEFIDVDNLFLDPSFDGDCFMYFDTIKPEALKLVHKGTGKDKVEYEDECLEEFSCISKLLRIDYVFMDDNEAIVVVAKNAQASFKLVKQNGEWYNTCEVSYIINDKLIGVDNSTEYIGDEYLDKILISQILRWLSQCDRRYSSKYNVTFKSAIQEIKKIK